MKFSNHPMRVFEHQCIKEHDVIDGIQFDGKRLKALQKFYGEKGVPYYTLLHNGVRFCEYVGVIQVGDLTIEVLPKADNSHAGAAEKKHWQQILIDMLRAVGVFDVQAPSSSSLKMKSNSILDLYFELFIVEIEYLLNAGLAKQYRKTEGNKTALKGSIQFNKHIQQNLIHQERFYVRHTTYDVYHSLHFILCKALRLIQRINTNASLVSRIGALLLHFPEMPDRKVTGANFEKIVFSRKTQSYKKAIEIARLLLLQYHPAVSHGSDHVLALMFDMNKLWEQFVYASLRKHKTASATITSQTSRYFWKPELGYHSSIRPDIFYSDNGQHVVLDTKWKNLNGYNPSPDDLRQMYAYHNYFDASRVALIYPGSKKNVAKGNYVSHKPDSTPKQCAVISLSVPLIGEEDTSLVKTWQQQIADEIKNWVAGED